MQWFSPERKGQPMHTTKHYMALALELAKRAQYKTSPNPAVGCVIVKNDQIIGEGFHPFAGAPHAEIYALNNAQNAHGATAYVTLEPCCHYGKTPPCTQALIKAGIKKLVIATLDPNPLVSGKGVKDLKDAGIEVEVGICQEEAKLLNQWFFHYIQQKRPFVIAKWAMSLDGKTTTHPADSTSISSDDSRAFVHQLRQQVDAILVGSGTALRDNPSLTSRTAQLEKQPIRIVLTTHGDLPLHLNLFDQEAPTIVATSVGAKKEWLAQLAKKNIETLIVSTNKQNKLDLGYLLEALGKKEITSLLVEGGMTVHENFFREKLVNQFRVFLAPVIIGTLEKKQFLNHIQLSQINSDYYFVAEEANHV